MSSPFVTALFNPLNLMILIIAAAAGLLAAWWLFPLGLLFWLIMVINLARNPAFRMAHTSANRAPLAQRFQTAYDRIKRAQTNLYNAVASMATLRTEVQPFLSAVNQLVDEVYALAQRMTALENFRLISQSNANFDLEVEHLTAKVQTASDSVVKQEYEEALQSLQQRIRRLNEATARLERVEAELAGLSNELNAATTDILHLQTLPREAAPQRIEEMVKALNARSDEIKRLE